MPIQIDKKTEANLEIIEISGSLDLQTVPVFKQEVNNLLKNGKVKIIFNLENLSFIDSAGLSAFISAMVTTKKTGGILALCSAEKTVARVFKITRMEKAFRIYPDIETAIKELGE
ncbi:MAG: STAS domain-containing protein [Candidatus Rifleibacteriota bacterium]